MTSYAAKIQPIFVLSSRQNFELAVNLKTAEALSVEMPTSILLCNKVIE